MAKQVPTPKRLLWIGDAVAHSGFATVTHGVLNHLSKKWDVHVLGVNYFGDPHSYPYKIYPAAVGGDLWGVRRVSELIPRIKPDVVCILNDPWIVMEYLPHIKRFGPVKVCAYMPVDAVHVKSNVGASLNNLDTAIVYTEFGKAQLANAGLDITTHVAPHGVDTQLFKPISKDKARKALNLPEDWFIVGSVARNQPRKRLDLTIKYFAEWVKDKPDNVKLYLHCALDDVGWDLIDLVQYYEIENRLIITSPSITSMEGVPRELMPFVYSSFDVQISTTMGEGWGLPVMEGMACGTPQIVPNWSALGEWAKDGAHLVECSSTFTHTGGINTIGGIPDEKLTIEALDLMYTNTEYRKDVGARGLSLATMPAYRWKNVASSFDSIFRSLL